MTGHVCTDLKKEKPCHNTQVENLRSRQSVTKNRGSLTSSEREDTNAVHDENDSPLAGSIPHTQGNDENAPPLAENIPPRRVPENITQMRRSTRRARGALQNELSPSAESVPPRRGTENIPLVSLLEERQQLYMLS
jgi:hypothetical protein